MQHKSSLALPWIESAAAHFMSSRVSSELVKGMRGTSGMCAERGECRLF